jgi:hypothetical protein
MRLSLSLVGDLTLSTSPRLSSITSSRLLTTQPASSTRMSSGSKTKKSSSQAEVVPGASSSKNVRDKASSSSKNGISSKSRSKSSSNHKKNGSRDEGSLSLSAVAAAVKKGAPISAASSDGRNNDASGMVMPPTMTSMKRREERDRVRALPQRSQEDAEVDAATSSGNTAQHCGGGIKTTIGTGKFRASPILKNPKCQAQDGADPQGKDQGDGADGSHKKEHAANLDGAEFHPHDDRARGKGAADSADRARYAEYDRWERDPYYGEGGYGRWPAPRPRKADGDERDLLDAEGGERGPNVISPNRPPYPPNHPGYNRYYGERSEAERPASAARPPTRERETSAPGSRSRERDRYYEDDRLGGYDYPPTPSRRYADPYAYEHGPYSPTRSHGAESGSASMYQYSPVRTKSKDFDRDSEPPRDFMEPLAKSPDGTPVRKENEALEGSPAWRPRHSEYPSHSPPRVAWDVGAISTPREGPPPPPHYSPGPSGFGYLASPREGWGPSPYRGPPVYPARAGDGEGLPKWMDSPDCSLMPSPKKPARPMFREKSKEEKEKPRADEPGDKRSLPATYPLQQNTWSFGGSFGGSFDEHDIPKSPYGSADRLPPQTPSRSAPPPPPEVDPYWNDYYGGGGYGPPPGDFGPLYSPRRAWASQGGRMPPPTEHSRASLPPPHSMATPMVPTSSAIRDRRDPHSASKKLRKSGGAVAVPAAVTPTSSQSVALQQYSEAVVYSKNRLSELLMLSSPAKSGSAQMQDIPPWETLPPAHDKLFDEVTSHDVLLGRGGGTNTQAGNKRFRSIVNAHQPMYLEARRKEKPLIARCIVEWIRLKGGRFLKKEDVTGKWHEVGDERAEAKTSQALREGLDVREKKSGMSSCGGSVGSSGGGPAPGSARKRKKEKTSSLDRHHGDHGAYDHHHPAWGDYPPPLPHSHYYGRPSFYDASRRIRGRDDYGHVPPPHARHPYYHHHGGYGPPPTYAPPPMDCHSPSKRIKWTDSSRSDNGGYPSVLPNVLSEDHDRERQYYKDFNPPPPSQSGKLPLVAPSYDQGDGP